MQTLLLVACGLCLCSTWALAAENAPTSQPAPATRPGRLKVLFIGNSQMSYCDVPAMVQAISESAPPDAPRIEAGKALTGGASLQTHWNTRGRRIEEGHWDAVVIQEIYNRDDPDFSTYAAKFDEAIRHAGSKTVLFATACVTSHYGKGFTFPESTRHLNDIQIAFGKKHGLPVAAAGYAWLRYLGPNPTEAQALDLYAADKGHPGPKGSYIYACLLYATLTGRSPVGLASEFKQIGKGIAIPKEDAAKMQQAAWEQYLESGK